MAETQPFDEFEVAETVYEILSRLYVQDREGAAREAAALGVAIEALATKKITEALRELLAPPARNPAADGSMSCDFLVKDHRNAPRSRAPASRARSGTATR